MTSTPTVPAEPTTIAEMKRGEDDRLPRPESVHTTEISSRKGSTIQVASTHQRSLRSWPQDALRVAFGLIWLIDAILKWLPGFRSAYVADITGAAQGQPGWLRWWFDFWVNLQTPRPNFFAYFVAVLETLIALALIFGFSRKLTYLSTAVFSFLMWGVAEGFGGPYMKGSTDIGTSIIYFVVSLGLLVVAYYAGTSRYSVDHYIEPRISWWWKLAEVGCPVPVAPTLSDAVTVPDFPEELASVDLENGKFKQPVMP
jgi:uncharacterized membrane protein YphA (DoxX/SURF4 family)